MKYRLKELRYEYNITEGSQFRAALLMPYKKKDKYFIDDIDKFEKRLEFFRSVNWVSKLQVYFNISMQRRTRYEALILHNFIKVLSENNYNVYEIAYIVKRDRSTILYHLKNNYPDPMNKHFQEEIKKCLEVLN